MSEVGYRRLAPGQPVGLKHAGYVISLVRAEKVSERFYIKSIRAGACKNYF